MLTDEQRIQNKLNYIELLSKLNIDLTRFLNYLESDRVDYFNKPYNCFQDQAYCGSLCEHSLKLYEELKKLVNLYAPDKYDENTIITVALLKDIYRAELFESYTKNTKNDVTGQWETQVAYRTKEERPTFGDANFSSYMIAKKFFPINCDAIGDEITEALCFATPSNFSMIDSFNVHKNYKLLTLATIAEIAVMYLGE